MQSEGDSLSTTAIARKLDIPVQQLFTTLKDYGWIERAEDNWALTPKGEFEGGTYRTSRRYGAYIVWPYSLLEHPLFQAIESNQRISTASMCRYYPHLGVRHINRALGELGLQRHTIMGWELTDYVSRLGGLQAERSVGVFFVTWPHDIIDHPIVHRELDYQSRQNCTNFGAVVDEPDLFDLATRTKKACRGIDGHELASFLQMRVCNWLYLAQLAHAYRRALPTEESIYADFYVPNGNVYIDCWEADVPAEELSIRLRKKNVYELLALRHLEVNATDMERLDDVLGRGLIALGVRY